MKKLKSCSGETLIESLAAILVVLLTFLALTASVTAAARINARAKSADTDFSYDGQPVEGGFVNIRIGGESQDCWSLDVERFETENGYVYYSHSGD